MTVVLAVVAPVMGAVIPMPATPAGFRPRVKPWVAPAVAAAEAATAGAAVVVVAAPRGFSTKPKPPPAAAAAAVVVVAGAAGTAETGALLSEKPMAAADTGAPVDAIPKREAPSAGAAWAAGADVTGAGVAAGLT